MNNVDLNAYGVEEMDVTEMRKTEGGCWLCITFLVIGVGWVMWRVINR